MYGGFGLTCHWILDWLSVTGLTVSESAVSNESASVNGVNPAVGLFDGGRCEGCTQMRARMSNSMMLKFDDVD